MALGIFFLAGCGQTQTSQVQQPITSPTPAVAPTQTQTTVNNQQVVQQSTNETMSIPAGWHLYKNSKSMVA